MSSGSSRSTCADQTLASSEGSTSTLRLLADPHLRICVDRPSEQVEAGLRRLASWRELQRGSAPVFG